jgi:hypothetical protein
MEFNYPVHVAPSAIDLMKCAEKVHKLVTEAKTESTADAAMLLHGLLVAAAGVTGALNDVAKEIAKSGGRP